MMRRIDLRSRADWGLAFKAAPVAAVAVLTKLAVDQLGWDTVDLNPLYSGLVAATVFLLGFLLAGTLADYKESERLPGELAARTEAIADECHILFRDKGAASAQRCLDHLAQLAATLHSCPRSTAFRSSTASSSNSSR
jgi:hypothetical protein